MEETNPAERKDDEELKLEKTKLALKKSSEHARLGVLYLWQKVTIESSITKIIDNVDSAYAGLKNGKNSPPPEMTENESEKIDEDTPDELESSPETGLKNGKNSPSSETTENESEKINEDTFDDELESSPEKQSLMKWAEDFVSKLWNRIKQCFGDLPEMAVKLKTLAVFLAKQVFTEAAPIIGSVDGLLGGLYNTTKSFCERFGAWLASRDVRLSSGHPTAIVNGITRGMNRSLLEGVYQVAKNSVTLGLNIASSGITSIIEPMATVLETITMIMWRIAEISVLRTFVEEANDYYSHKDDDDAFHKDELCFTTWLMNAVRKVPLIAGVTYASHIVGDKMIFLQMFSADGDEVISQEEFDRGVKYLEKIKTSGTNLLKKSDLTFDSSDDFVKATLKRMVDPPVLILSDNGLERVSSKEANGNKKKKGIMGKVRGFVKKSG